MVGRRGWVLARAQWATTRRAAVTSNEAPAHSRILEPSITSSHWTRRFDVQRLARSSGEVRLSSTPAQPPCLGCFQRVLYVDESFLGCPGNSPTFK